MVTIVLLAYNEGLGLPGFLRELDETLRAQARPYRLLVVDDGSTDDTVEQVRRLSGRMPVSLVRHERNLGVGRTFDTGLRAAVGSSADDDTIVTMEGDRTNRPAYLVSMLERMDQGFDVVCASRYRRGGRYVGFPLKRRLMSLGANWCMRLLFPIYGVRDYTIFFRAYRARVLRAAIDRFRDRFIERAGFTSNAEILFKVAQAGPVRCCETPLVYRYDLKESRSRMKVAGNTREYSRLFLSLLSGPIGEPLRQSAVLASLCLGMGLWGIHWGVPGEARLRSLLPDVLLEDPGFRRKLADEYRGLYERLERNRRLPVDYIEEAVDIPGGWTFPPERLLDSYRSFFLRSENPDEQKNITYLAHLRPWKLRFEPYGVGYGGAFIYSLGAWYAAAAALGAVRVTSDVHAYLDRPELMADVFVAGRLFNVLAFAGCAVLLASMARGLGGACLGWLTGMLWLCLPVTAVVSHTLNPYGWAGFWAFMGLRWLLRYLDRREEIDFLKASAGLAMCVGSSIAFWAIFLALPMACLIGRNIGREGGKLLLKAAAVSGAIFFLTNPYLFLKFRVYQGELSYLFFGFPFEPSWRTMRDFLFRFLWFNMGPGGALLAVGGGLYWACMPGTDGRLRLLSCLFLLGAFQLAMRLSDPAHGRHFLPYMGAGCLVAAYTMVRLQATRAARRLGAMGAAAGCAAVLGSGAAVGAPHLWNMKLETRGVSTRLEAARWIQDHVPPGSSIGLVAPPQPADTPPFHMERYRLVLFETPAQLAFLELPEHVVLAEGRTGPEMETFLEANYRNVYSAHPRKLLPWVDVVGTNSLANARMEVWRRKASAPRPASKKMEGMAGRRKR